MSSTFEDENEHRTEEEDTVAAAVIAPATGTTTVDGQGMWRAWTRVFAKPESAALDLLDNCFDAALRPDFHGKVSLESASSILFIRNNSQRPIKRLKDTLTVYKSSKNSEMSHNVFDTSNSGSSNTATNSEILRTEDDPSQQKDAIGENGVGLKHGCATLTDCSVIITRNSSTIEIGFICRQLQTSQGVYLPSFSFEATETTVEAVKLPIHDWLQKHGKVQETLATALRSDGGFDSVVVVEDIVAQWVHSLWNDYWKEESHVFLLVLCNLKKSAQTKGIIEHSLISFSSQSPASVFLKQIKKILPEYYINLPSYGKFDFLIDRERIEFSFWQRRLVELTKFEVHVPTSAPFESLPDHVWVQGGEDRYKLSIYCGFDAHRVNSDINKGIGTSTCRLYIYSCQAGRLILKELDARFLLGLSSSGVDFTQGLTVIVNDSQGKLPLTPTKDGIAWSERPHGDIHRQNLYAWAGAVAQLFWTYHRNSFVVPGGSGNKKTKEEMKNAIRSFAVDQEEMDDDVRVTENMEEALFTQWTGIVWRRVPPKYGTLWSIRKQSMSTFYITSPPGPDTLFVLSKERIHRPQNPRKRKAASFTTTSNTAQGEDANASAPATSRALEISDQLDAGEGGLDGSATIGSDRQLQESDYSVSARGRRRQKVDYNNLEKQYDSVVQKKQEKIKVRRILTKGGRSLSKLNMQSLEDELQKETLKRREAEAERDNCKNRIRELQTQLAARDDRIRVLEGRPPAPRTTINSDGEASVASASSSQNSTVAAPAAATRSIRVTNTEPGSIPIPASNYHLETIDEKEAQFKNGTVVYCQFPQDQSEYIIQWQQQTQQSLLSIPTPLF